MQIDRIKVTDYEQVLRATDPASGLKAFIAVHSTALGPAIGGTRMWPYENEEAALKDVLRLSAGMTWKSAVAGTGLGGGKSVIIGDSRTDKAEPLLRAMGRFVDRLDGIYYAAEDVGTTPSDLEIMAKETQYVTGLPRELGGSGNPSPFTAQGVFRGIQACVAHRLNKRSLAGVTVAVQGLGSVGAALCRHLKEADADLILADIDDDRVTVLADELEARTVPTNEILSVVCDVLAPCALGGIINSKTIPQLRCSIVAGAANNQLEKPEDGEALRARGILYAPDFVINAGGIINIAVEVRAQPYDAEAAHRWVDRIHQNVTDIIQLAEHDSVATNVAALMLARRRVEERHQTMES